MINTPYLYNDDVIMVFKCVNFSSSFQPLQLLKLKSIKKCLLTYKILFSCIILQILTKKILFVMCMLCDEGVVSGGVALFVICIV